MINEHGLKPQVLHFSEKLTQKMSNICNYPLTFIEAPSGFGKTTALNYFFESDKFEAVPVYKRTFLGDMLSASWNSFCEVIANIDKECAKVLQNAGTPTRENMVYIEEAIQDIECEEETYIVLDNFGDMRTEEMGLFLNTFSRHGGEQLHIVVSTLQLPGDSRGELTQNHQIYFLTVSDFIFSKEDTDEYFKKVGIVLTKQELESVCAITGGWVFALYIQLLAYMKNEYFEKGSLHDLIESTFWNRLNEDEQSFYISVSAFQSFTVLQAVFVSGRSADYVKTHLKNNGFVHFDTESLSFYFHSILSAYLKQVFSELPLDKQSDIYIKSGLWSEKNNDRLNTLRFYYKAGAYEHIFRMPLTSYEIADIASEDTRGMILDILEKTPMEIKIKYPFTMVPFAFALFILHENEKLMTIQLQIREIVEKSSLEEKQRNLIYGEMELLLSFLKYNRIDEMNAHHSRALELLGGPAILISTKSTWTFGSPSVLYLYYRESGALDKELEQMDECMPEYYHLTGGHGNGAEFIMRAEAAFLQGEFEQAEILCHRAMFAADSKKQNSIYQCGLFLLARLAMQRGDDKMFADAVRTMSERAAQNTEDLCRYTPDLAIGFLQANIGRIDLIPEWLCRGDISEQRLTIMAVPFAQMIYSRILLAKKAYKKLLGITSYAMDISSIFPNILPQVYLFIYMAAAHSVMGNEDKAAAALKKALALAMPDRIYMPFVENIVLIGSVLLKLQKTNEFEQIFALGRTFESSVKALKSKKPRLSPREYEVAMLAKEGLTNKQISQRLFVSVSTVKMILSHIFEKTGIVSRTQIQDLYLDNSC